MKKKYLHIFRNLKTGGNQKIAKLLIKDQLNEGAHVDIITTQDEVGMANEFLALGVQITLVQEKRASKRASAIREIISDGSYALVYTWFFPFSLRFESSGARFIHHVGTAPCFGLSVKWVKEFVYNLWFHNAKGTVVFASEHIMRSYRIVFLKRFPIEKIIYNGIDTTEYKPPIDFKRKTNTITMVMIGRLDGSKNFEDFLRLAANLKTHNLRFRLQVIGSGPLQHNLEKLATDLNVEEYVEFLGERNDVPNLLRQADIFIFLNKKIEGFGIVLIEAMATALPVIAYDLGASGEIVDQGKTGYLVNDVTELAERVQLLMFDKDLRSRLGQRARLAVKDRFSDSTMVKSYREIESNLDK